MSKAKAKAQVDPTYFLVTLTWKTEVTLVLALFDTFSKAVRYAAHDVLKAEMRRKPRAVTFDSEGQTRWFTGRNGRFYLTIHELVLR